MYLLSHALGFFFVWRKCQILQKSSHPHDSVQMSLPPGSSIIQSCLTLCDPMDCSTPGLPVHHQLPSLLKLMSIELVIPPKHLILCHPGGLPWTLPSLGSQSLLSFGWPSSSQCLIHLLTYLRMHVLPWQHSGVRSPWDWILALPFTTCMTLRSWSKPFCLFFSFNP